MIAVIIHDLVSDSVGVEVIPSLADLAKERDIEVPEAEDWARRALPVDWDRQVIHQIEIEGSSRTVRSIESVSGRNDVVFVLAVA
jgi:hypothetical protein